MSTPIRKSDVVWTSIAMLAVAIGLNHAIPARADQPVAKEPARAEAVPAAIVLVPADKCLPPKLMIKPPRDHSSEPAPWLMPIYEIPTRPLSVTRPCDSEIRRLEAEGRHREWSKQNPASNTH
ncbi:MAG: hypothetical protein AB7K09_00055 [Planctomycetota bacterium]